MSTAPHYSPADEATHDLLALVADPDRATGRDAVDAFLAACRRDARANGGMVSVNRVRDLLTDAQIPPRRYSALWSHFTGPGKPMRRTEVWELNTDKAGRNSGKPTFLREWAEFDSSIYWREFAMSDCDYGCKVYRHDITGQERVMHNSAYGCRA